MKTTRRDVFKFAAGGAAGLLLTPAPWRLVTDAALWSENWPGIPRPVRGEIRTRFTHCALCPAGCAVRARCVGEQPIALAGLPGQPLCAFGLSGHQLPYHAGRVTGGDARGALDAVRAALARRGAGESIAILDLRPGRAASWMYRRALGALPGGIYLAPQSGLPAVDLEVVKTILSLGVPVLDGWGTLSRGLEARKHFRLIQAEAGESRTAALADEWLPIRAGSEEALAQGILGLLSGSGGTLADAVERTGMPESSILSAAKELAAGDALVLAVQESPAVLELNRLLGGRVIVKRREAPVPAAWRDAAVPATQLGAIPDHSIRTLLIDESVSDGYFPWIAIEPKLARGAAVVTFASSRLGYGRNADFVLPVAVYPEVTDDIPAAIDAAAATFRLARPLVTAPKGMMSPVEFVCTLAGIEAGDPLRERAAAIHAAGRGTLISYADAQSTPVKETNVEAFWKALHEGGCWIDESGGFTVAELRAPGPAVVALTWEMRAERGPMPPLISKLYQESNLRVRA